MGLLRAHFDFVGYSNHGAYADMIYKVGEAGRPCGGKLVAVLRTSAYSYENDLHGPLPSRLPGAGRGAGLGVALGMPGAPAIFCSARP